MFLKLETVQPTFSYKIRGAFNAILTLLERHDRAAPLLVTASAGNHGRALAHAARAAGLSLTVYVPAQAPRAKTDAIRAMGVELIECRDYDEAESRAKEHAASGRALYISPYSHPDVIAGAGTIGLELLEDIRDLHTIVVPVGGGGLVSGIAVAVKSGPRSPAVIGIEVEASSPFTASLAARRIVPIDVQPTLADGLAGNLDPDTITFDLVSRLVDDIVVVSESQLRQAIGDVFREEDLVIEGAAAVGIAALTGGRIDVRGRRVAVILSGANINPETIKGLV